MKDLVESILAESKAQVIVDEVQERLTAEKKNRQAFYDMAHEHVKAEFVNGEIIIHSPVKKRHSDATGLLLQLLNPYVFLKKLGYVGFEKIMTVFTRNDYEPDLCFFKKETSDHFKEDQSLFPIPDFVVEVLSTNEKHDRQTKYKDYEEHGVQEYWIVDPKKQIVEQYILKKGKYELALKAKDGKIRSETVQGFVIPIRAIFDKLENLKALRAMLGVEDDS